MNIENYKAFKALPEQYKSTKFCKLYYKMYNYMLSIPKEKIIIMKIVQRNNYVQYLFSYIYKFIEAKDFYKWKERVYSLMTEIIQSSEYRKFELYYRSKAKEYYNKQLEKSKATSLKNNGTEWPMQSKEVQEKSKATYSKIFDREKYSNIEKFRKVIERLKSFRILESKYKIDKFVNLYMKIYNYTLEISPKDIVIAIIRERNSHYIQYLFKNIITKFIEAKDFYHWKNRIYSLLTEKLKGTSNRKFELLYRSKAKEFHNIYSTKMISTLKESNLAKYNTEYSIQSKEVQERVSNTWNSKTKEEVENIVNKRKSTSIIKYNTDNPAKSDEIKEKQKATWNSKTKEEKEQIQEKRKATNIKNYGVECNLLLDECKRNCNNHSKPSDEMCEYIDKYFGYPEDSWYAIKNKEFHLASENKRYYYDYINTKYKFIIEFQGSYWHALYKNPDDIIIYPGGKTKLAKEVWAIDEEKKLLAEKNGYKVFYVYEDEYRNNKSKCLENLIKEIKNYVHSLENDI